MIVYDFNNHHQVHKLCRTHMNLAIDYRSIDQFDCLGASYASSGVPSKTITNLPFHHFPKAFLYWAEIALCKFG